MLDTTADIASWSWFLLLTLGGISDHYVSCDWGSDVITLDRTSSDCIALGSSSSSQSDLDGNRGSLLDLSRTCDAVVASHSACCGPVLCPQPWWYWHFVCCGCGSNTCIHLTHWGQDKMVAILWTAFSKSFSRMWVAVIWFHFDWILFPIVQLAIKQHLIKIMAWFRIGGKPLSQPVIALYSLLVRCCRGAVECHNDTCHFKLKYWTSRLHDFMRSGGKTFYW